MSIKDALKALCQKLTSQESDKDSIAGVIEDIAEKYTPGEGAAGPQGPTAPRGSPALLVLRVRMAWESPLLPDPSMAKQPNYHHHLTEGEPQTVTGRSHLLPDKRGHPYDLCRL